MLKNLYTQAELQKALEETRNFPSLIQIHYTIKINLLNLFPENNLRAFLHENTTGDKLWILVRSDKYSSHLIIFGCESNAKFDTDALYKALTEFATYCPNLYNSNEDITLQGQENFNDQYEDWLSKSFDGIQLYKFYSCALFYISEVQKNELMSIKILIPDQYFIDEVKSDEDLDIIIQTMEFTKPEEKQHYKGILISILNIMPYSLIRDKNSGLPVAFEYVDSCGYLRHQFVQPDHRRQGLGKAVEQDICKKCINFGITPYKWVGLFNSSVYEATMRSGFWTLWEDNGEPVKLRTMKHTTANMPKS